VFINGNPISGSDENSLRGKDVSLDSLQSQEWLSATLLWDFDNTWKVNEGEYPKLAGQTTINFDLPAVYYGDQISLSATSDNTTVPITYKSSDNTVAEISGNLLTTKKAGNVTITALQGAGDGFFAGYKHAVLTILKKELTITAHSTSITYGDMPPVYTCQYTGFINGDTETTALSKLPSLIPCQSSEQCRPTPHHAFGSRSAELYVYLPTGHIDDP
jgi:hypothetical protein